MEYTHAELEPSTAEPLEQIELSRDTHYLTLLLTLILFLLLLAVPPYELTQQLA